MHAGRSREGFWTSIADVVKLGKRNVEKCSPENFRDVECGMCWDLKITCLARRQDGFQAGLGPDSGFERKITSQRLPTSGNRFTCGWGSDTLQRFRRTCFEDRRIAMFCPTCGTESPQDYKFCKSCGAALGTADAAQGVPAAATLSPQASRLRLPWHIRRRRCHPRRRSCGAVDLRSTSYSVCATTSVTQYPPPPSYAPSAVAPPRAKVDRSQHSYAW